MIIDKTLPSPAKVQKTAPNKPVAPLKNKKDVNIQDHITQFYVSDTLKGKICDVASTVKTNPYKYITEFRKEAADKIVPLFPKQLISTLKDMGNHKGKAGINIQNMPTSRNGLCPTPADNTIPNKSDFVSEAVLAAIADVIGGKMATQNHNIAEKSVKKLQKEPIEQIVPNARINNVPQDYKLVQFIHIEDSNKLTVPDVLLVSALRGDKNAQTVFLPADKIYNDLDKNIIKELEKKQFIFRPEAGEEGETTKGAVLYTDKNNNKCICFHTEFDATEGMTKEAENAIWTLRSYLTDKIRNSATVTHNAGDIFISDNHRSLHGTYPFENSEGLLRWLQRAYLTGTGDAKERANHDQSNQKHAFKEIPSTNNIHVNLPPAQ